jgi:hypothetical protein
MEQTELTVVNSLLQVIGESPLNEVDLSDPDVLSALDIWEEVSSSVQSIGYWYNTESWDLPVTTEGFVYVPANVLTVVTGDNDIIKRGNRLYNLDTHSYDFSDDDTVSVDLTTKWDLEELPPVVFNYILAKCKVNMVAQYAMESNLLGILLNAQNEMYHRLQVQDLKAQNPNATATGSAQVLLQNKPQR